MVRPKRYRLEAHDPAAGRTGRRGAVPPHDEEGRVQPGTDPRQVVEALAGYEDALGDLYAAFAVKFPRRADLWDLMSHEEHGHAGALRSLLGKAEDLAVFVDVERFDVREVTVATQRLREQTEVAQYSSLDLREALAQAVELERSMIESRALTVFQTDTPSVVAVLDHLREQSSQHRERLRAELSAVR